MNKRNAPSPRRERRLCSADEALSFLFARIGTPERERVCLLWRNWRGIMEGRIAPLGFPLGYKDRTLLVGAEDTMALQELSMQSYEILEHANAFMGSEFFTHVRVSLMQGQADLGAARQEPEPARAAPAWPRIGALTGRLRPDSPIARCYEAIAAQAKNQAG